MSDLPDGVTRHADCVSNITLRTCHAVMFRYRLHEEGRAGEIIAWREPKPNIWSATGKRLRDLRPGDEVLVFGYTATLTEVIVYR